MMKEFLEIRLGKVIQPFLAGLIVLMAMSVAFPGSASAWNIRVEGGWRWLVLYGHSYCHAETYEQRGKRKKRVIVDEIECFLEVRYPHGKIGKVWITLYRKEKNENSLIVRDPRANLFHPVILGPARAWACATHKGVRKCTDKVHF